MKTFLLLGIGGVYNYGCEAIVRGTEAIIHAEWPDAKIIYASNRPEDDRKRLQGSQIEVIRRKSISRYSIANITRKLFLYIGVKFYPRMDSLSLLKGVDAVLSIGGDIYTLYVDGNYDRSLPKLGDAAEKRNIPYILWCASVGPFTPNPAAERFFQKHLSNISMIVARESDSIAYLANLHITSNVIFCADPAFIVAPEIVKKTKSGGKTTIAINLSPLSSSYLGSSSKETIERQARMIERIVNKYDAEIILVPHVVCDFLEDDDDLRYLHNILDTIDDRYRDSVRLVNTDPGFIGIKKVLIKCDLVIAARMHCAINAITAYVPTLLLSYSQKTQGMSQYVYGHRDWLLTINDFCSDNCLTVIDNMLFNKDEIHGYLANRISEIRNENLKVIEKIKGYV